MCIKCHVLNTVASRYVSEMFYLPHDQFPSVARGWATIPYAMKVLRQKSFTHFACLRNFLYESSRWCCSSMDLRESKRDFMKVFSQRMVYVYNFLRNFCLEAFIVYCTVMLILASITCSMQQC